MRVLRRDYADVSPFIYSLRVPADRREALIEHLGARGVDVGIHFVPVHKHTYFAAARRIADAGDRAGRRRGGHVAAALADAETFVERVIDGVRSFFS